MEIKASDVKTLRERTGAGMMDCKKALAEAGGDFAKAEKLLKELGLAQAARRGGRATNEGRVFTSVGSASATVLEIACETDFVARNSDFVALGNSIVSEMAAQNKPATAPEFAAKLQEAAATIKENMSIRRGAAMAIGSGELVTEYVHGESGRIGVLVKVKADKPELLSNETVRSFAFDLALHVAAFRPQYLSTETVDAAYLKEQQEIFLAQAKQLDKPENVLQGIAKGKLKKHLSEICFFEQPFVKDEKQSVASMAQQIGKSVGGTIAVADYLCYMVGEQA